MAIYTDKVLTVAVYAIQNITTIKEIPIAGLKREGRYRLNKVEAIIFGIWTNPALNSIILTSYNILVFVSRPGPINVVKVGDEGFTRVSGVLEKVDGKMTRNVRSYTLPLQDSVGLGFLEANYGPIAVSVRNVIRIYSIHVRVVETYKNWIKVRNIGANYVLMGLGY